MKSEGVACATGVRWQMTGVGEELARTDLELAPPEPGRAVVRVAGCGVCHTDLGYLFDGVRPRAPLPLTLGHEISGEVVAAAEGLEDLVGRAVIVPAVTPCGECASCEAGHGTICTRQEMPGNDIQGGFATHVDVMARGLCVVDDPAALSGGTLGKSDCTLAELSVVADAVTTPYQAARRAKVQAGDLALVIGLGGVGGFAAQIARAMGATVIGFDVNEKRLELLSQHGVEHAIDPSGRDAKTLKKEVRGLVKGAGLPSTRWKIFECSGTSAGQELAWSLLVPGAYLSVVGFTMDMPELRLSNLMAFDAKACGNWGCLPELYPGALQLVLDGHVALKPFVETFPLEQIWSVMNQVHEHRISRRPVLIP
jgi:6-hydroxycyclohex-1-ene-1-carbonyl-CoA dehydrogenase